MTDSEKPRINYASEIRKDLFCGDCINCKLQVWDSVSKLDDLAKRGYLIDYQTAAGEKFYLVRCGWTKDNVLQPHKMLSCDGKTDFATAKAREEAERGNRKAKA